MEKIKILVTEDETIVAMDLKRRLTSLGYQVINISASGEDCISKSLELKPDLILMDIILKGSIDGIKAAEIIKSKLNIPIVYLTAHTDENTIQRAKITGPYGYILKPYEIRDLHSTIEIALYKAQMERQLEESELKYRTLVATATDAVLMLDESAVISSCNDSAIRMFGYDGKKLIGESVKKILPEILDHLVKGASKLIENGKPVISDIVELIARKRNGDSFPVELSFSQWNTDDIINYTLIIRDITKRKEYEKALKTAGIELERKVAERTAELSSLLDQSPVPIMMFETNGDILYVNKAYEKIWCRSLNDLLESKYNLFDDDIFLRYGYLDKIKQIVEKGGSYKSKPVFLDPLDYPHIQNTDGLLLIYHFFSVTNDNNKVFRIVSFIEDITDKIKAEETNIELKELKEGSEIIIERLEQERARISRELHDGIGQLLSAIKFNIELFEKTQEKDEKSLQKSKQLVSKAGIELKNIIYALHPSFLDSYGLPVAVKSLCDEVMNSTDLTIYFSTKGIEKRLNSKIELFSYRIIQEALNNTVKHSGAGSAEVKLYLNYGFLFIHVKDNGKGFDIKKFNADNGNKSFGLLCMKERVEMLKGNFQIDSKINSGTEIYIEIPVGGAG